MLTIIAAVLLTHMHHSMHNSLHGGGCVCAELPCVR